MIKLTIQLDGVEMIVYNNSDLRKGDKVDKDEGHAERAIYRWDARAHVYAFKEMIRTLANEGISVNSKVLEVFGGSGWSTSLIKRFMDPMRHYVWELEELSYKSILYSFESESRFVVGCGDSFEFIKHVLDGVYDFISADWNAFTFKQIVDKPDVATFMENIFDKSGRFVHVTDSGIYGVHRWGQNRRYYEGLFGGFVDEIGLPTINIPTINNYRDYFIAMRAWVYTNYGYYLRWAFLPLGKMSSLIVFDREPCSMDIIECEGKIDIKVINKEIVN